MSSIPAPRPKMFKGVPADISRVSNEFVENKIWQHGYNYAAKRQPRITTSVGEWGLK